MAIWSFITDLLGIGSGIVKGWQDRSTARTEQKLRIEEAKVRAQIAYYERAQNADIEWEKIMAEGSKTSWKDEWFVILLSLPFIGSFIPGLADYVARGFANLRDLTPEWYIVMFGGAVAASFGIRNFKDIAISKVIQK